MDIASSEYKLKNLNTINIILGKNGCGKSSILRHFDGYKPKEVKVMNYITPERGGFLHNNANVEQSMNNENNVSSSRRRNQFAQFKEQTIAHYKKLERLVLIDGENFQNSVIDKINTLLDNIYLFWDRNSQIFIIKDKSNNGVIPPESISSGESELISLAIEFLIFAYQQKLEKRKVKIILVDEPDVHLHPDLQSKLAIFIHDLCNDFNLNAIISTHSTSIVSALSDYDDVHLCFMKKGMKELNFSLISKYHKDILPIFGAHPLSQIFNEKPILLLEGASDVRIWQQAIKSSRGLIKIYPCECRTVINMNKYEIISNDFLESVFDNPRAFSLRDRDDSNFEIDDYKNVIRMKLSCSNLENLALSNEVLYSLAKITWSEAKDKIEDWLIKNKNNNRYSCINLFKQSGFDRKSYRKIKDIIYDLIIIFSNKPKDWERIVGQEISKLKWNEETDFNIDGSLLSFLGEKTVKNLLPKNS